MLAALIAMASIPLAFMLARILRVDRTLRSGRIPRSLGWMGVPLLVTAWLLSSLGSGLGGAEAAMAFVLALAGCAAWATGARPSRGTGLGEQARDNLERLGRAA